jgi:hypothetical protein
VDECELLVATLLPRLSGLRAVRLSNDDKVKTKGGLSFQHFVQIDEGHQIRCRVARPWREAPVQPAS